MRAKASLALVLALAVAGAEGATAVWRRCARPSTGPRLTLLSGNGAAACSFYTAEALKHTFGGFGGSDTSQCDRILGHLTKSNEAQIRRRAAKIDTASISLHGITATVRLAGITSVYK